MKLSYKRTILVGFAFFLICAFWQIYDVTIAMTLTNKFGLNQTASGVVLALDNILALFMLPLFGKISDNHKGKSGRRTPFIRVGTIAAVILLVVLSFVDYAQLQKIEEYTAVNNPTTMERIYNEQKDTVLKTPDGKKFRLENEFTCEEFVKLNTESTRKEKNKLGLEIEVNMYTQYVVPARQACAAAITDSSPITLYLFLAVLLLLLIAMATFRTPAVALMPDVTIKPLRSKANAVINLMGNAGGMIVLILGSILAISKAKNAYMNYMAVYGIVGCIMLIALLVFLNRVKEAQWASEMQEESKRLGISEEDEEADGQKKLGKAERKSLILILLSVVFWYFGYNAVTSKYAVYAQNVLDKDATLTLLLANAAAIVTYLPVGYIASKVGRRKTVLAGVSLLFLAFFIACFMTASSPDWLMYIMFCLAGIGWATINVNAFPMAVEMCSGSNVGKYTGYYYTASMAAQALTPMLSGYFMDKIAMTSLFPYAAMFVAVAFITMFFVKHGDSKPVTKKGLEAMNVED